VLAFAIQCLYHPLKSRVGTFSEFTIRTRLGHLNPELFVRGILYRLSCHCAFFIQFIMQFTLSLRPIRRSLQVSCPNFPYQSVVARSRRWLRDLVPWSTGVAPVMAQNENSPEWRQMSLALSGAWLRGRSSEMPDRGGPLSRPDPPL
jgi:hypothetical protein